MQVSFYLDLNLKEPDRILIQRQGIVQIFNSLTLLILHFVIAVAYTVLGDTI